MCLHAHYTSVLNIEFTRQNETIFYSDFFCKRMNIDVWSKYMARDPRFEEHLVENVKLSFVF